MEENIPITKQVTYSTVVNSLKLTFKMNEYMRYASNQTLGIDERVLYIGKVHRIEFSIGYNASNRFLISLKIMRIFHMVDTSRLTSIMDYISVIPEQMVI